MKKGKTFYLWIIIIIFIILWIPFFQNAGASGSTISFFTRSLSFTALYPWILLFGVIEGALIVIYLKTLVDDMKMDEPKKFDL